MMNKAANPNGVCSQCGKQMQRRFCGACDGKRYTRKLLFFKTKCTACSGTGTNVVCVHCNLHFLPSSFAVPAASQKAGLKPVRSLPNLGLAQPRSKAAPCSSRPRVPPQVPPPWHPSYPNPWHPMNPLNPRNQPFNPLNPNSPTNPISPLNPNNPLRRK